MYFISLKELKEYLRITTHDDDKLIGALLESAFALCCDIARLTDTEKENIQYGIDDYPYKDTLKVAVLYAVAYLYEHREEADHHALTLTLRSILFARREGVF